MSRQGRHYGSQREWRSGEQEVHCGVHGSGVAILDYDRDGWMDIFLINGKSCIRSGRK